MVLVMTVAIECSFDQQMAPVTIEAADGNVWRCVHVVEWMATRLLRSLSDHAEPGLGVSGHQPGYKTRRPRIGIATKQTVVSRLRIGVTVIRLRKLEAWDVIQCG